MLFLHTVGEKEDENVGDAAKTAKASDLLEPKEELLSADEEESEEEDDELTGDEEEEETTGKAKLRQARVPNESQQQNWQPAADVAAATATTAITATTATTSATTATAAEVQHPGDTEPEAEETTSLNVANGHCKTEPTVAAAAGKFDFNLHILLAFGKRYISTHI